MATSPDKKFRFSRLLVTKACLLTRVFATDRTANPTVVMTQTANATLLAPSAADGGAPATFFPPLSPVPTPLLSPTTEERPTFSPLQLPSFSAVSQTPTTMPPTPATASISNVFSSRKPITFPPNILTDDDDDDDDDASFGGGPAPVGIPSAQETPTPEPTRAPAATAPTFTGRGIAKDSIVDISVGAFVFLFSILAVVVTMICFGMRRRVPPKAQMEQPPFGRAHPDMDDEAPETTTTTSNPHFFHFSPVLPDLEEVSNENDDLDTKRHQIDDRFHPWEE